MEVNDEPVIPGGIPFFLHGREIDLMMDYEPDESGQFRIALYVDGKERYAAWFTDKSEHNAPIGANDIDEQIGSGPMGF